MRDEDRCRVTIPSTEIRCKRAMFHREYNEEYHYADIDGVEIKWRVSGWPTIGEFIRTDEQTATVDPNG